MAGPLLRACGHRRDQLIAAIRGGTVARDQRRDLLQQALILACLPELWSPMREPPSSHELLLTAEQAQRRLGVGRSL